MSNLPFFKLEKLQYIDQFNKQKLLNCPSFNIQSLLDSMKHNNDDNGFLSDSINSSYYDSDEFSKKPCPNKNFSLIHLNIASLQLHIDELVSLLQISNKNFDIICISETRLKEDQEILVNIDLPGYSYFHTPTKTACGGTLIYYKNYLSAKILSQFCHSVEGIFESTFVEIKSNNKSMVVGNIYRHPKADETFITNFLEPTLNNIGKMNKKSIISGDFNFDLIKYESHNPTQEFYDLFSSYSYRPCILQPSRVTYKSKTLIDNIFTNDLSCIVDGGNLTHKISDHFSQFVFCDILSKTLPKKVTKFKRDFKHFKNDEFLEELARINWAQLETMDTENAFNFFYKNYYDILNTMAPLKKMTHNEQRLKLRPWISKGILKSIKVRNSLYKQMAINNSPEITSKYKQYRNLIVTLQKRSKELYYKSFFEKNKNDIKKTWKGIKNILSVSKKNAPPLNILSTRTKYAQVIKKRLMPSMIYSQM